MPASRTVLISGAGIGGLAAALSLARRGFQAIVFEQAERLEETGAGIQISPNASRILIDLGLADRLRPHVVAPEELRVFNASTGQVLARAQLGAAAEQRYGAPYWVAHRGDLQAALYEAAGRNGNISLRLGVRAQDYATYNGGVTLAASIGSEPIEERGMAIVGADGLWSSIRRRLGHRVEPRFARHTAWRALVPRDNTPPEFCEPAVNLWLGRHAHLVHYPVKAGRMINIVAIVRDDWHEPGWSAVGNRDEILQRFPTAMWQQTARDAVALPKHWLKWALYDCPTLPRWSKGPVTLLGDAAHPVLPYLAQGAAMAIEDAAVLAVCLERQPERPDDALRDYEARRRARTARVQRAARRNGVVYHMGGAEAFLRSLAIVAMGGQRLIRRYDWLYGWTPP